MEAETQSCSTGRYWQPWPHNSVFSACSLWSHVIPSSFSSKWDQNTRLSYDPYLQPKFKCHLTGLLQGLHMKGSGKGCRDFLFCNDTLSKEIFLCSHPPTHPQISKNSIKNKHLCHPLYVSSTRLYLLTANTVNESPLSSVSTGSSGTGPMPFKKVWCQQRFGNLRDLLSASSWAQYPLLTQLDFSPPLHTNLLLFQSDSPCCLASFSSFIFFT